MFSPRLAVEADRLNVELDAGLQLRLVHHADVASVHEVARPVLGVAACAETRDRESSAASVLGTAVAAYGPPALRTGRPAGDDVSSVRNVAEGFFSRL